MSQSTHDDHTQTTLRIELFSDAVIAIIVTLLILEIKIPELHELSNAAVRESLVHLIPKFIGFVVSFVTICIVWVNHHHFFHSVSRSDRSLLWYNNHLLFWLAVIPFVTGFIGEYPTQPLVIALYGFVLMMAIFAFRLMVRHAFFKGRLIHSHVDEAARKNEYRRSLFGIILYGISVAAAFIHPYISLAIFILVPVYYFLPRSVLGDMAMNQDN